MKCPNCKNDMKLVDATKGGQHLEYHCKCGKVVVM